jgi:hypothetical protein
LPRTYHNFVGFKVAKPLLERAFRQVYGLKLGSVLFWEDLSIKVYRTGASEIIPALTQAEWKQNRKDILRLDPHSVHPQYQYRLSPQVYSRPPEMSRGELGFMRPWKWRWPMSARRASVGWFAAATVWLIRVLPKVGTLHPLEFKPPTLQVQKLFISSFDVTVQEYEAYLLELLSGRTPVLPNRNLDVGDQEGYGQYELADRTYEKLLDRIAKRHFSGLTPALQRNIFAYYRNLDSPIGHQESRKEEQKLHRELAKLKTIDFLDVAR